MTDGLLDASLRLMEHWDAPVTGDHPDGDGCVPAFEKATMDARQAHAAALATTPSDMRAAVVVEMENEGVVTWGDERHRARFLAIATPTPSSDSLDVERLQTAFAEWTQSPRGAVRADAYGIADINFIAQPDDWWDRWFDEHPDAPAGIVRAPTGHPEP